MISIAGSVALEAVFFQKPSIMLADMGFLVLPSIQKLTSLEELPAIIRKGLDMKVNSDDLDRYVTILDENSFDFDLPSYLTKEANFFRFDGNFIAKRDQIFSKTHPFHQNFAILTISNVERGRFFAK